MLKRCFCVYRFLCMNFFHQNGTFFLEADSKLSVKNQMKQDVFRYMCGILSLLTNQNWIVIVFWFDPFHYKWSRNEKKTKWWIDWNDDEMYFSRKKDYFNVVSLLKFNMSWKCYFLMDIYFLYYKLLETSEILVLHWNEFLKKSCVWTYYKTAWGIIKECLRFCLFVCL